MSERHVDRDLLTHVARSLGEWYRQVPQQKSRHVWSLLPLKVAGAQASVAVPYTENDDRKFMERFLMPRDNPPEYPFFDPFSHEWLPTSYFHSNMATFRKNTFMRSWNACTWDGHTATLTFDYADIFADRVLRKGGKVTRIPALSCAIWFYKKPSTEWPVDHPFNNGLPDAPQAVIDQFREDFSFQNDAEWETIFAPDSLLDTEVRTALGAS